MIPRDRKSGLLYPADQDAAPQAYTTAGVPEDIARKYTAKTPLRRRQPIPIDQKAPAAEEPKPDGK